jgi:hypothetical protein
MVRHELGCDVILGAVEVDDQPGKVRGDGGHTEAGHPAVQGVYLVVGVACEVHRRLGEQLAWPRQADVGKADDQRCPSLTWGEPKRDTGTVGQSDVVGTQLLEVGFGVHRVVVGGA